MWKIKNDYTPHRGSKPYWFFVDKVIPHGSNTKGYPNLAIQEVQKETGRNNPPFEIDSEFIQAFYEVMSKDEFSVFRGKEGEIFHIKYTFAHFAKMVEALQRECKRLYDTRL
jgi:hypothetical protein